MVQVMDPRKPRGQRLVAPTRYFTSKIRAEKHLAEMQVKWSDPGYEITLRECMI